MVKSVSKKISQICSALSSEYSIKMIDCEYVIYRNLENGFDFEVSGLDNKSKKFNATLYIWNIQKAPLMVETVQNIDSLDNLKQILETKSDEYLHLA